MSLSDLDLYLIGEGRHEQLWNALGAHVVRDKSGNITGTSFAVWAPNARSVSLVGDHNSWVKDSTPMSPRDSSGIWEVFVPEISAGARYKFAILGIDGRWVDHADPMARQSEVPPATASIVS